MHGWDLNVKEKKGTKNMLKIWKCGQYSNA